MVTTLAAAGIRSVVTGHQPHGDCPVVMRCVTRDTALGEKAPQKASPVAGQEVLFITADTSFSADTLWTEDSTSSATAAATGATPASDPPESPTATATASTPPPVFGNPRGPPPPLRADPRGQAVVEVLLRPTLLRSERRDASGSNDAASPLADGIEAAGDPQEAGPPAYLRLHGVLSDGRPLNCAVSCAGDVLVTSNRAADWSTGALAVGSPVDAGRWWVKARMPDGSWLLSRGDGYEVTNMVT